MKCGRESLSEREEVCVTGNNVGICQRDVSDSEAIELAECKAVHLIAGWRRHSVKLG